MMYQKNKDDISKINNDICQLQDEVTKNKDDINPIQSDIENIKDDISKIKMMYLI
jgi:archaellum component FlaC